MPTIHATHGTSPEYAGNAALDVTAEGHGVHLVLDTLQEGEPEATALMTPQEARALAQNLLKAAGQAQGGGNR